MFIDRYPIQFLLFCCSIRWFVILITNVDIGSTESCTIRITSAPSLNVDTIGSLKVSRHWSNGNTFFRSQFENAANCWILSLEFTRSCVHIRCVVVSTCSHRSFIVACENILVVVCLNRCLCLWLGLAARRFRAVVWLFVYRTLPILMTVATTPFRPSLFFIFYYPFYY